MSNTDQPTGAWLENWTIILVSFSALLTAWCAYQANLWTGTQTARISEAINAETDSSRAFLDLDQHKAMDGFIAVEIVQALADGRSKSVEELTDRARPEYGAIISAWLALDPLENKQAPKHPLAMPEYRSTVLQPALDRVAALQAAYEKSKIQAAQAGSNSDQYVLTTVLLAMILFLCGVSATAHSPAMKKTLVFVAFLILFASLRLIAFTPKLLG